MLIQSKRIERFLSSLTFPLPVLAATSSEVAAFLHDEAELRGLIARNALIGVASRSRLKLLRFANEEEQAGAAAVDRSSGATRALPSVDWERSDKGHASYVMRRVLDDGRFVKHPSFRKQRAA